MIAVGAFGTKSEFTMLATRQQRVVIRKQNVINFFLDIELRNQTLVISPNKKTTLLSKKAQQKIKQFEKSKSEYFNTNPACCFTTLKKRIAEFWQWFITIKTTSRIICRHSHCVKKESIINCW